MDRLDTIKAKLHCGDTLNYEDLAWFQDHQYYELIAQFYERDIHDPLAFTPEKVRETILYWYLAGFPERAIRATEGIRVSDHDLKSQIHACQALAYLRMGNYQAARNCAVEIRKLDPGNNLAREVMLACDQQGSIEIESQDDEPGLGEWLEIFEEEPELRDWHKDPAAHAETSDSHRN